MVMHFLTQQHGYIYCLCFDWLILSSCIALLRLIMHFLVGSTLAWLHVSWYLMLDFRRWKNPMKNPLRIPISVLIHYWRLVYVGFPIVLLHIQIKRTKELNTIYWLVEGKSSTAKGEGLRRLWSWVWGGQTFGSSQVTSESGLELHSPWMPSRAHPCRPVPCKGGWWRGLWSS